MSRKQKRISYTSLCMRVIRLVFTSRFFHQHPLIGWLMVGMAALYWCVVQPGHQPGAVSPQKSVACPNCLVRGGPVDLDEGGSQEDQDPEKKVCCALCTLKAVVAVAPSQLKIAKAIHVQGEAVWVSYQTLCSFENNACLTRPRAPPCWHKTAILIRLPWCPQNIAIKFWSVV